MTIGFGILLLLILGVLSWFDLRQMILPDIWNAALALSGLVFHGLASADALLVQLCFAAAMFVTFWLVRRVYFWSTGRAGLGLGDVKMAGAAATWLNPFLLPLFVFVASGSALIWLLGKAAIDGRDQLARRQPFGPFLALGLLVVWTFDAFSFYRPML